MSISVKWAIDGKPVWYGSFTDHKEFIDVAYDA